LYAGRWPLTLDVQGESCPTPVVKTKGAIDSGSMSDIDRWASGTDGVELFVQEEGDGIYTHHVRKTE
jgi:TusA-related sulfurtransferase